MENEFYQDLAETYINEESNTNCESDNGNVISVINDNGNVINVINTCVTATITTDLWTSRSKEGYIGVTCHWLSPKFEPIDILLAIERMPYPHTNEIILNYLKNLVEEFGLSNKIICGVTDNGSNMRKAFDTWEGVERLPCTAHTLQLSVNKALIIIKPYVKRFKKLVKFFSTSPKQSERLDKAQIEVAKNNTNSLNNFQVLRNITSIKTRWNSSYISWSRLLILRKSIQWLADTLPYETNNDSKKDARRLKQCLLQDYEWDLLEKVLLLLKPFEEATTFFSGAQYPTLSLMYPTIQKLKIKYACDVTGRNRKDDNDNDESQKKSNPPPRPNLNNIAMIFQQKIYESLFDYWNQTSDIGLLATLLDPRLKKMVLFDYETRMRTIEKLNELYLELKYVEEQDRQSSCISSSSQATKVSPFFESIFGNLNDEESELSEVDRYLDLCLTPIAQPNENPWIWWKNWG
nr:5008_t:CDS:2 [Entrophospora candida]